MCLIPSFCSHGQATRPPFEADQPLPCLFIDEDNFLNATGAALLDAQGGEKCLYPYPESLGIEMECVFEYGVWGWRAKDPAVVDVFMPDSVLADFCVSNFFSRGNILVPPSSNISLWRDLSGDATYQGVVSGLVIAEGTVYNYGQLLVTFPFYNLTHPATMPPTNGTTVDPTTPPASNTPANPTLLQAIYTAQAVDTGADDSEVQFWQDGQPDLQCQTIVLSYVADQANLTTVEYNPPAGSISLQINMEVFDQCSHDVRWFVGVVAGVGGAIMAATFIYAIVALVKAYKESKEKHLQGPKYVDMKISNE